MILSRVVCVEARYGVVEDVRQMLIQDPHVTYILSVEGNMVCIQTKPISGLDLRDWLEMLRRSRHKVVAKASYADGKEGL